VDSYQGRALGCCSVYTGDSQPSSHGNCVGTGDS